MRIFHGIFTCIVFSMMVVGLIGLPSIITSSTLSSSYTSNNFNFYQQAFAQSPATGGGAAASSSSPSSPSSSSSASANTPMSSDNSSSPYKFERGYPVTGTVELAYNNTDPGRAIEAYKFFYPTMVTEALMQLAPPSDKPNQVGFKFITAPRHELLTPNSDTPYAVGVLDLKADGPIVIELPPGNFIGFVNDHNTRWVLDMGNNGPDKGQGGKHLVLPPDYKGNIPAGYYVGQSATWKAFAAIRTIPPEGNATKALQMVDGVKIYPLAKAGQPVTFHFVDVTDKSFPYFLLQWEDKLDYWKQLKAVIDAETTPTGLPLHVRDAAVTWHREGNTV